MDYLNRYTQHILIDGKLSKIYVFHDIIYDLMTWNDVYEYCKGQRKCKYVKIDV